MIPLISIILPFYNAEKYLHETIISVIKQSFEDFELLLINDGSTDQSKEIAQIYSDKRIKYFEQQNKGVSAARNLGLKNMLGDFFCFLDADDILPPKSLESRIKMFLSNPEIDFVDGKVNVYDAQMHYLLNEWKPKFKGAPLHDLVSLSAKSFLGLTWMVRRKAEKEYQMLEGLTHGEDLLFYMELVREGGLYDHTDEVVLHYRNHPDSAMKNLEKLEFGYRKIEKIISSWDEVPEKYLNLYKWRYKKSMALSYLSKRNYINAVKVWV